MITQDELKSVLSYDLNTGLFVWLTPTGDRVKFGQIAGSLRPDGYVFTQINKRRYMNHRLAWLYVNGAWPSDEIDHIDGDRSNNRLSNLRLATSKQNKETPQLDRLTQVVTRVCIGTNNVRNGWHLSPITKSFTTSGDSMI